MKMLGHANNKRCGMVDRSFGQPERDVLETAAAWSASGNTEDRPSFLWIKRIYQVSVCPVDKRVSTVTVQTLSINVGPRGTAKPGAHCTDHV